MERSSPSPWRDPLEDRLEAAIQAAGRETLAVSPRTPPVDLRRLSNRLGVLNVDFVEMDSDGVLRRRDGGFDIVLNSKNSITRNRFSWAHELGHLLFDRPVAETPAFRNASRSRVESCCDTIASEILIPRHLIDPSLIARCSLSAVPHIARDFRVSQEAAARRMVTLADEHCVLTVWRLPTAGVSRKHVVAKPQSNRRRDPLEGLPAPTGGTPPVFSSVHKALASSGVVHATEMVFRREQAGAYRGVRRAEVYVEALSIGSAGFPTVVAVAYLDRESG